MDGKEEAQLTNGKWEVTGLEAVDEEKGLVYFNATEKTPVERHLYRVGLDGKGFTRITKQDGVHTIQFSPDASGFLDTYSNAMMHPQQSVSRADGSAAVVLNKNEVPELAKYHLSPQEFITVKTHDGMDLNAWVIKP